MREIKFGSIRPLALVALLALFGFGLAACDDGPAEDAASEAGAAVDDAVGAAGEAAEGAGEAVGDAAEGASEAAGDAVDEAGDEVERATE